MLAAGRRGGTRRRRGLRRNLLLLLLLLLSGLLCLFVGGLLAGVEREGAFHGGEERLRFGTDDAVRAVLVGDVLGLVEEAPEEVGVGGGALKEATALGFRLLRGLLRLWLWLGCWRWFLNRCRD